VYARRCLASSLAALPVFKHTLPLAQQKRILSAALAANAACTWFSGILRAAVHCLCLVLFCFELVFL
jgi:hypothetical protein